MMVIIMMGHMVQAITKILDVKVFHGIVEVKEGGGGDGRGEVEEKRKGPPITTTMWRGNVMDHGYEVMVVSQFTLCGRLYKKNRPDFHKAMGTTRAKIWWEKFVMRLGQAYLPEKVKVRRVGG